MIEEVMATKIANNNGGMMGGGRGGGGMGEVTIQVNVSMYILLLLILIPCMNDGGIELTVANMRRKGGKLSMVSMITF